MDSVVSTTPLFTNDAVVFGFLTALLALIFKTTQMASFKGFYKVVPSLLLCYFLPSVLNTLGVISPGWIEFEPAPGPRQSSVSSGRRSLVRRSASEARHASMRASPSPSGRSSFMSARSRST